MSLPKLDSPYFPFTVPSTKTKIKIRPFTVKEEKLLLMAAQDRNDTDFILSTIHQILKNCIQGDVNVESLATFDVEELFIRLRARSVDNVVTIKFRDDEDEKTIYEVKVNLDDVSTVFDPEHSNKIALNDTYTITMKYPTFGTFKESQDADPLVMIGKSIDKLVNVETSEIYDLKDFKQEEVSEFIESFTSRNMRDIENFFKTMPSIKIEVKYIKKDGSEQKKEIVGLVNFFTL